MHLETPKQIKDCEILYLARHWVFSYLPLFGINGKAQLHILLPWLRVNLFHNKVSWCWEFGWESACGQLNGSSARHCSIRVWFGNLREINKRWSESIVLLVNVFNEHKFRLMKIRFRSINVTRTVIIWYTMPTQLMRRHLSAE